MKRVALIGHRGVGKSSLLKRIASAVPGAVCLDLDTEIESREKRTIHSFFAEGESVFRAIERETFERIERETYGSLKPVYIAVGGGFDPSAIDESWDVWWIRRATDATGRIFTDRPRLNAQISALDEYLERFAARDHRFRARADRILWLDEGCDTNVDPAERAYLEDRFVNLGGTLTLLPEAFRSDVRRYLDLRLSWGLDRIELRDDLLSHEQMVGAIEALPIEKVLISFRSSDRVSQTRKLTQQNRLDWPMELGASPVGRADILSLHHRGQGESLKSCLARLTQLDANHYKAALPVKSFDELWDGYEWWKQDPKNRSFLPHSSDGRWAWYRRWIGRAQLLNFIREGEGSGADQPTLLQWARGSRNAEYFAAVLGDPVAQSRTPLEQFSFFNDLNAGIYAIRVTEDEMNNGALDRLRGLGLRWAAVTAPLKGAAFRACRDLSRSARELEAVNTLEWENDHWSGTNTDLEGLQLALKDLELGRIAVWGGGGTLNVIKKCLPEARFYSLRTVEDRDPLTAPKNFMPGTVVWAIGRLRASINEPPASWRPKLVVDLNYAEDSPGRAFAIERGSRYISGLEMFRAQAAAQRRFWQKEKAR